MATTDTKPHQNTRLKLIDVQDLCDLWKVKPSWIYDEVAAGRLKPTRLGRQLRFREADLDIYLDSVAA